MRRSAGANASGDCRASLAADQVFTDWQHCIERARPDLIILCPSTGDHALWVERLAPLGLPLLLEKPMASSLAEADSMIEVCARHDVRWAINWPLVWVAAHRTAKRLIDEGRIGEVIEVHYYDGNRGPLWHTAGKREITAEEVAREKPHSWFYQRSAGGGSLSDYLGYGVTLGTWFNGGQVPLEVRSMTYGGAGLEVDEHSITIARYERGLSKFETRWGPLPIRGHISRNLSVALLSSVTKVRCRRTTTRLMCAARCRPSGGHRDPG